MRISDWSSDVCSSDLLGRARDLARRHRNAVLGEQFFCLIFVKVHVSPCLAERACQPRPTHETARMGRIACRSGHHRDDSPLFSPPHATNAKSQGVGRVTQIGLYWTAVPWKSCEIGRAHL